MSSRILCINCGLWLNRGARHIVLKQTIKVVTFIAERISPRILTEHDKICQACLDVIMTKVDQIILGEISSKDEQLLGSHTEILGHYKVCVKCGRSVLRRRAAQVVCNNPSELQKMIATIIANSIESQELTPKDKVCHPCWLKAQRAALRCMPNIQSVKRPNIQTEMVPVELPSTAVVDEKSQIDHDNMMLERPVTPIKQLGITDNGDVLEQKSNIKAIVEPNPSISSSSSEVEHHNMTLKQPASTIKQLGITDNEDVSEERSDDEDIIVPSSSSSSISSDWSAHESSATSKDPVQGVITVQNYRRAHNTASKCIFSNCSNQELHRISNALRIQIIFDYHVYLPVRAKVCADHLISNMWKTLFNSENSSPVFTVKDVENVFSFVNFKSNVIDFNDPLSIDNQLFQYWLGITKETFRDLLNEVPEIQGTHGVKDLVEHLIELRNSNKEHIKSNLSIKREENGEEESSISENVDAEIVQNTLTEVSIKLEDSKKGIKKEDVETEVTQNITSDTTIPEEESATPENIDTEIEQNTIPEESMHENTKKRIKKENIETEIENDDEPMVYNPIKIEDMEVDPFNVKEEEDMFINTLDKTLSGDTRNSTCTSRELFTKSLNS